MLRNVELAGERVPRDAPIGNSTGQHRNSCRSFQNAISRFDDPRCGVPGRGSSETPMGPRGLRGLQLLSSSGWQRVTAQYRPLSLTTCRPAWCPHSAPPPCPPCKTLIPILLLHIVGWPGWVLLPRAACARPFHRGGDGLLHVTLPDPSPPLIASPVEERRGCGGSLIWLSPVTSGTARR